MMCFSCQVEYSIENAVNLFSLHIADFAGFFLQNSIASKTAVFGFRTRRPTLHSH